MAPLSIRSWASNISVILAIVGAAQGASKVEELGSDLTILLHNDLYGDASPRGESVLILGSKVSGKDSQAACEALEEKLWNPTPDEKGDEFLSYLGYKGRSHSPGRYWIAGGDGGKGRSITPKGEIKPEDLASKLPVICTHSATNTYTKGGPDTSDRWRTTVKTGDLEVTGFRDKTSFRFQGLRYADQPKRFEYPSVHEGSGKVDALAYSPNCYQPFCASFGVCSEDCLFLNVFTPYLPSQGTEEKKLRPVMIFFHGGGYVLGAGGDPTYDGSHMASRGDVVIVTINYRLGSPGFIALDDGKTNGNFALADQIASIDWVHEHIRDFGGDPERITIFGQSAGGASVRALAQSPKAIGKFAAGISMSNLGGLNYAYRYSHYYTIEEQIEELANPVLNATGCLDAPSQVDCLREVDILDLVTLGAFSASIVIDGTIVTEQELPLDGSHRVANVPMMMGYMHDDGGAFIGFPKTTDLEAELWKAKFNGTLVVESDLFPIPSGPNATLNVFNVTNRVAQDTEFRCLDGATAYAGDKNDVFPVIYHYDWVRTYQMTGYNPNPPVCEAPKTDTHPHGDPSLPHFRCHTGELYYIWGALTQSGLPSRDDLDIPMSQYSLDTWTSFARTHNPNPDPEFLVARHYTNTTKVLKESGPWEPFDWRNPGVRQMDWPSRHIPVEDEEQCELFEFPLDFYDK